MRRVSTQSKELFEQVNESFSLHSTIMNKKNISTIKLSYLHTIVFSHVCGRLHQSCIAVSKFFNQSLIFHLNFQISSLKPRVFFADCCFKKYTQQLSVLLKNTRAEVYSLHAELSKLQSKLFLEVTIFRLNTGLMICKS